MKAKIFYIRNEDDVNMINNFMVNQTDISGVEYIKDDLLIVYYVTNPI